MALAIIVGTIAALIVGGVACFAGAPEGFQTDDGFFYGTPPDDGPG